MTTPIETLSLKLSEIVTNAGTQIRACLDTSTVDDYAAAMTEGAIFPPVVVFHDGSRYILADGFHRVMAATRNGYKDIEADVRKGAKSDALKFALGANSKHGLKRTNSDKRRSVILSLDEWPRLSDVEVSKMCAVSTFLVHDVRKEHQPLENRGSRIGRDGKERKLPVKKTEPKEPEPQESTAPTEDAKWKEALGGGDVTHINQLMNKPEVKPFKPLAKEVMLQEFKNFLKTISGAGYSEAELEWLDNHLDAALRHHRKSHQTPAAA